MRLSRNEIPQDSGCQGHSRPVCSGCSCWRTPFYRVSAQSRARTLPERDPQETSDYIRVLIRTALAGVHGEPEGANILQEVPTPDRPCASRHTSNRAAPRAASSPVRPRSPGWCQTADSCCRKLMDPFLDAELRKMKTVRELRSLPLSPHPRESRLSRLRVAELHPIVGTFPQSPRDHSTARTVFLVHFFFASIHP